MKALCLDCHAKLPYQRMGRPRLRCVRCAVDRQRARWKDRAARRRLEADDLPAATIERIIDANLQRLKRGRAA